MAKTTKTAATAVREKRVYVGVAFTPAQIRRLDELRQTTGRQIGTYISRGEYIRGALRTVLPV
jgi:hypothetical protein